MNNRFLLLLLLVVFRLQPTAAQLATGKYLILLKDKANSPYSPARPLEFLSERALTRRQKQGIPVVERDLPVNPAYLTAIRQTGARIWFASRWANAVLVSADNATLLKVQALPFVKGIENDRALSGARTSMVQFASYQNNKLERTEEPLDYGNSTPQVVQLGVDKMHQGGFRGEGMLVGILDAGFQNADRVPYLQHLFREGRIAGTYDFVDRQTSVYEDDDHGLAVLSVMAGYQPGRLIGPAYKASYLLLRTEDPFSETPVEEANWLFGVEYADSAGVDVINSSLGYTRFQSPFLSHRYQDLDGKTTLITRAARWAAEVGMLVVVSAGNEGDDSWRYIGAPADAPNVLSIGAVDRDGNRAFFSSFGPTADGRVKPDLVAIGQGTILGSAQGTITAASGTSFSAPLIAALAAGVWQANPQLTAQQVIESLRRSGNQADKPDNERGYGIPDFTRASTFARETYLSSLLVYPNPFTDADRVVLQWNDLAPQGTVEATLTNLTGQTVWRQVLTTDRTASLTFPTLHLAPGLYFLTLRNDKLRRTVKLLKQ